MRIIRVGAIVYTPFGDIARYWADCLPNGTIKELHWKDQKTYPIIRVARAQAAVEMLKAIRKSGGSETIIMSDCPTLVNAFQNSTASLAVLSTLQIDIQKEMSDFPKPKPNIVFAPFGDAFKRQVIAHINGGDM